MITFYFLEIEPFDRLKYCNTMTLSKSEAELEKQNLLNKENIFSVMPQYKNINIKEISVSIEEALLFIVKHDKELMYSFMGKFNK